MGRLLNTVEFLKTGAVFVFPGTAMVAVWLAIYPKAA
jgi:hypothetical protein